MLGAIKTLIPPILTNTVTIDVIPMIEAPLISISGADAMVLHSPQWSPADWDNWPLAYQRTVFVHELNHIRNKDPQKNLLKSVLLAMHFFNPLIWILLKKLDQYSENQCDDSTIANPEIAHQANLYQFYEAAVKPEMLHKELLKYPKEARKDKIEGKTVITLTIDESGTVEKAKVYVSSHPILDDAALTAVKKCKFKPAELDGKPVRVKMNVPYSFKLK